jgi:hypothetical protein
MVLQRVCGDAKEDVNQSIVPYLCEKRLFVGECVGVYNLRCRVRDFNCDQLSIGNDAIDANKLERVFRTAGTLDHLLHIVGLYGQDFFGHRRAISYRINDIPQVFWQRYSELLTCQNEIVPFEENDCCAFFVAVEKIFSIRAL